MAPGSGSVVTSPQLPGTARGAIMMPGANLTENPTPVSAVAFGFVILTVTVDNPPTGRYGGLISSSTWGGAAPTMKVPFASMFPLGSSVLTGKPQLFTPGLVPLKLTLNEHTPLGGSVPDARLTPLYGVA